MEATAALGARTRRLGDGRLGLWLFFASESILFFTFLGARFYLQGVYRPPELNQPLGLAITMLLVLSSFTAYRAEVLAHFGQVRRAAAQMGLTILLGALFLAGVAVEWSEGLAHFPPGTGYGTLFFAMTGLHASHVLSGVVILALVLRRLRRETPRTLDGWLVEGAVKYWHFVDVVWVFFYPTLYLVS